jgi:MFS family permease
MDRELASDWRPWPVWSAVWVGALSALAVGLIIGLIGYAIGAHQLTAPRTMTFRNLGLLTTIFSVGGAFFAFVVGGWVAARIVGTQRAEPAILHGAIAWLVTIPLMILLSAVGATVMWGSWYSGLVASPAWVATPPATPEIAEAVRNGALATVAALLLGLVGSVIGGWMASGEPMTLGYYRRRQLDTGGRARRAA